MTTRPIIFSAPMVRALFEGRKAQTRRLIASPLAKCEPGDLLWVRESFAFDPNFNRLSPAAVPQHERVPVFYESGAKPIIKHWHKVRPSIHMPRWCSRLTLEVTSLTTGPLSTITDADAIAEGVVKSNRGLWLWYGRPCDVGEPARLWGSPRAAFADLWNWLHGDGAFKSNPEVAAINFKVYQVNVDSFVREIAA